MGRFKLLFSYPLLRATAAGLSFSAAVLGARVLPVDLFSTLVTTAFLAKFLHILNFGATAGYFVNRYSGQGPLAYADSRAERCFAWYFLAQLSGLGVVVTTVTFMCLPEYRTGAIAFVLLAPLFVAEPLLRYRRLFSFSLAPDFLLALALTSVIVAYMVGVSERRATIIFLGVIAGLGMAVVALTICPRLHELRGGNDRLSLRDYAQVALGGGPVFLGTALFLIASSMDRLLLPLYGTDKQISIYFLAYQLSVGSMIFVTALNFVNTVNLGETRKTEQYVERATVAKKMRSAALVALGSYFVLVLSSIVLEEWFLAYNFDGLTLVVAILGLGLALFFVSNAITPIVAYFNRQIPLTISMACVALALAANNAWIFWSQLGVIWLAAGTALALFAHATFAIWFTFSVLRQQNSDGSAFHSM
jgi:O-antigen/teichoic acid export membrane protein